MRAGAGHTRRRIAMELTGLAVEVKNRKHPAISRVMDAF